jgi:hypothetical protein
MDRLQRVDLPGQLAPGRIFLHTAAAVRFLMDRATACPDSSGCVDRGRA